MRCLVLYTRRVWRWSCKFCPTSCRSSTRGTPTLSNKSLEPMPESCKSCGEPMAPSLSMTSQLINTWWSHPNFKYSMPMAFLFSSSMRVVWALVNTVKLTRPRVGLRKPLAVLHRTTLCALLLDDQAFFSFKLSLLLLKTFSMVQGLARKLRIGSCRIWLASHKLFRKWKIPS